MMCDPRLGCPPPVERLYGYVPNASDVSYLTTVSLRRHPFYPKGLLHRTTSSRGFPEERVRNFSIVAHVDHGKSTLADRLLETTGVIEEGRQVLDHLPVERERGITVKAQSASMVHLHRGHRYLLNLIDTPGHVTSATKCLALWQPLRELCYWWMLNRVFKLKLWLISCSPLRQTSQLFLSSTRLIFLSPTLRESMSSYTTSLDSVLKRAYSPSGSRDKPLCVLLFDSWYDHYRGVVCVVAVKDGSIGVGDEVSSYHTGLSYEVAEVGLLQTKRVPIPRLYSGQVGYVLLGMRNSTEAHVGDTFYHTGSKVTPLPGFIAAKPMVFAGFYPMDQSEYPVLRTALEKLTLNDSSVSVFQDSSVALGQGWRLGFLGLLHMDVFRQRLEEEFDASILVTTPSVPYKVVFRDGSEQTFLNPAQFPEEVYTVEEFREPVVLGTLVTPDEHLGKLLSLCQDRRGVQQELVYMDQSKVLLKYTLPLSEVVIDFNDQVKSLSSGYASFDYEEHGYEPAPLVKLDVMLNGRVVDALASVVHRDKAYSTGKTICGKLKDNIHRQLFEVAIQAAIGKRIIARETVKALRKNVTAKCYGGDITRKMKLLRKQKEGKKKMKQIGNVELSKDAFLSVIQR
ncbi:Translation factor GUF1, mitochondrial [Geodia barretti]|uniref:Translation factor GUF1 homolog, mitochondrial n=1 Tax=Geodia barretti TaxID=519541 RepID=A0AA35X1M8_GEOBA|nr:Translation factor GUF1, mitochondrial [Geodia barretti]